MAINITKIEASIMWCLQSSYTLQPRARPLDNIPNPFNYMIYYHDDPYRIRFAAKTQLLENALYPVQNKKNSKCYSSNYLNFLGHCFLLPKMYSFPPKILFCSKHSAICKHIDGFNIFSLYPTNLLKKNKKDYKKHHVDLTLIYYSKNSLLHC